MIKKIFILFIILCALFTRFYKLSIYPPSPNWDEISHTYNAYSILETGKDQWGQSWPIFNFRAYGDYPTTLNMYIIIPFVKFLGINTLSGRLPTAILSFLTIPLVYLLSKKIFNKKYFAIFTCLIYTLSPWTIFSSRHSLQATVAQFFLILGIILSINRKLFIGFLFFALSAYAYHNTRIIIFPLLISFLLIYKINIKKNIYAIFLFLILALPVTINLLSPSSRARSSWVYILNQPAINVINQNRGKLIEKNYNPLIARLISNKITYVVPKIISNYLNFLNPQYLFFQGTQNKQLNMPGSGQYFWIYLPFFYIGLISIFKYRHNKHNQFLLTWFVIGLIPSVITSGDFPIVRAISIIPVPFIFISHGLYLFYEKISTKFKTIFISLFLIINSIFLINYWRQYTKVYAIEYASSWQYGYKQMVNFIKENYNNYDNFYITKKYGEPHEFILFYWPWPPSDYQNDSNKVWDYHDNWYWVDAFDKFKFVNDWEIKNAFIPPKSLLITSPENYSNQGKIIQRIYYPNNQVVFDIVSYE